MTENVSRFAYAPEENRTMMGRLILSEIMVAIFQVKDINPYGLMRVKIIKRTLSHQGMLDFEQVTNTQTLSLLLKIIDFQFTPEMPLQLLLLAQRNFLAIREPILDSIRNWVHREIVNRGGY